MNETYIRIIEERDLRLLKSIEEKNSKKYIKHIDNDCYISIEELLTCLDDTQDNREYAEEKLTELSEHIDNKGNEYIPTLDKHYIDTIKKLNEELTKLKEENNELRNEALRICNEDALDRLANNGVIL